MPRDNVDAYIKSTLAELEADDERADQEVRDPWGGATPVSGVEGILYGGSTPETIEEMGEAARKTVRYGLPIAGAIAGGVAAGPLGEMMGGAAGEILGAGLSGEMPDTFNVLAAAAAPGIGRAVALPFRAMSRSIGRYTPGYAIATHDTAISALDTIKAKFMPVAGSAQRLYGSPLLKSVKTNVDELAKTAREIFETQMAEPIEGRIASSLKASKYVLKKLGYSINKAGTVTDPAADAAIRNLSINEKLDVVRTVWGMKRPAAVKGLSTKHIKQLYRAG